MASGAAFAQASDGAPGDVLADLTIPAARYLDEGDDGSPTGNELLLGWVVDAPSTRRTLRAEAQAKTRGSTSGTGTLLEVSAHTRCHDWLCADANL